MIRKYRFKKVLILIIFLILIIISKELRAIEYSEREKSFNVEWEKKLKENIVSIFTSNDKNNSYIFLVMENGDVKTLFKDTGEQDWVFSSKSKIKSNPIMAEENFVYGTWDGTIFSLNSFNGSEKWKIKAKKAIYSSPLYFRERIYAGSWDGYLRALRANNGKLLWEFKTKDAISTTPVIYDNIILFGSMDGYIYALDTRDGSKLWNMKTDWPGTSFSPVVDKGNALIFTASSDNNVYALSPDTGKVKWRFPTESPGIYTEMVLIENKLFIPSYDGYLYCITPSDGKLEWKLKIGRFFLATPPTLENKIFIATDHGELMAINIASGNISWQFKIAERIRRSPQIFENMIFLCSDQGFLYGIDPLFGEIMLKYIVDYYPDYILHYDYFSEMFYLFTGEEDLLAFKKEKGKEDIVLEDEEKESILLKEYLNSPTFSPDGKYYLYSTEQLKGDGNLYRAEIADSTLRIVGLTKSRFDDLSPKWCPDSTAIVFSSNRDGNYNIYRMNMLKLDIYYYDDVDSIECTKTENSTMEDLLAQTPEDIEKKYLKKLTKESQDEKNPVASHSGSKIVYSNYSSGNWDLWIMDSTGENKLRLTYEPSDDEDAKFCPDETKIVYTSSRMNDRDIYTINIDATGLTQLSKDQTDDIHPEWICDSTIVFEKISQDKKYSNIWIINNDGSNTKFLTSGNFFDRYPKPSPDGKKIIFISNRKDDTDNLWLISPSGNGLIQITNFLDEVHIPSWSSNSEKIIVYTKDINSGELKTHILDINKISLLKYFVKGEELISKSEYEEARNIYEYIVENYPNQELNVLIGPEHFSVLSHLAAFYKLAVIAEQKQNPELVYSLYQLISEDTSGFYDKQKKFSIIALVRTKLADQLFKKEEYEKAIDSYKKVLEDFPDMKDEWGNELTPYINIRIAESYEKLKRYQQAINSYLTAQKDYPDARIILSDDYIGTMAVVFNNLARIYELEYHDYDRALQYNLKILEKYPKDTYTTVRGVTRGNYTQKVFMNIERIYTHREINFDNWISSLRQTNEIVSDAILKKNLQHIINNLEVLSKGEKLVSEAETKTAKIIFCSRKKAGSIDGDNYEIFIMNEDGTELKRLTYNDANDYRPSWSPDGSRIVYHTLFDKNYEIFVMDSDGTNMKNLSRNEAYDFEPAWAPDGTRLSFTSDRDGNMDIFVANEDGGNPVNITSYPSRDFESNWNPSGDRVVFTSDRDGNLEIYLIDIAMGTITNLSRNNGDDHEPVVSPDGSKIIFTSNRDGNEEIYIMDIDGSNQYNLTNTPAFDYNPTWSYDGKYIFFISNRKGPSKVYRMKADGTNQVQLTVDPESYEIQPNVLKGFKF
ncbi:MAG: PD40 domain-containing protein [Candidatus Firestonebacteria bacterium]|nr:PD40 domain-containing protein [Candidatus Firestonebacteria bacterium]